MTRGDARTALVTGAARGIGKGIADRLGRDGARLVVVDVDEELLRSTAAELDEIAELHVVVADVGKREGVDRVLDEATRRFERVDVLVNNAGIQRDGRIEDLTDEQWTEVLDVDLRSAAMLTRGTFGPMKQRGWGRIVNISSVASLGNFGQANYAAAKAGLIGLTRTTALEGAGRGVTANVICPGVIETPGVRAFAERAPKAYTKFIERVPARRAGEPADVAAAVAFFCSNEAAYITGQTLFVAGGLETSPTGA